MGSAADDSRYSASGGANPLWAPDGRELFYQNGAVTMSVSVQTEPSFAQGQPEVLFRGTYFGLGGGRNYDVTADGQRFLMIRPGQEAFGPQPRASLVVVQNWFEELRRLVPTN